ncbi:MAG TPA: hypothetical protein VJ696_11400, partial [Rhodanobacteraceae bacterium]|nr:hypothetical protein [Rhodanobacteraceae bacterium]
MSQQRTLGIVFGALASVGSTQGAEPLSPDDVSVKTPYATSADLPAGQCIEYVVRETGVDAVLAISVADVRVRSVDAGIGRFGIGRAVYCADAAATLRVTLDAQWPGESARVHLTNRVWTEPPQSLRQFARAVADATNASPPADLPQRLEAAATALAADGDRERSALAWLMTMQAAGYALDMPRMRHAFAQASALHVDASMRRQRVVLLNDYALAVSGGDSAEAVRAIDEAFALQHALGDEKLAAAIENNRCLVHSDAGDLVDAAGCYGGVLERHLRIGSGKSAVGAARNNLGLARMNLGRCRQAREDFRLALD